MGRTSTEAYLNSCEMQEICLFSKVSRLNLGPTQSPIQWLSGALLLRMGQPRLKGDRPYTLSSVKVKNEMR